MLNKILGISVVVLLAAALIGGTAYILLRPDETSGAAYEGARGRGQSDVQSEGETNSRGGNGGGNREAVETGQYALDVSRNSTEQGGSRGGGGAERASNDVSLASSGSSGYRGGGGSERGGQGGAAGQGIEGASPEDKEWLSVTGTVAEAEEDAHEGLVLQTAEGTVQIELGQSGYVEAQGVEFQIGDEVQVTGFYEDGDALTAGTVENLTTGETLVLRDESGRPMWAGGPGRIEEAGRGSEEAGRGSEEAGRGSEEAGRGSEGASPEATEKEWLSVTGTVVEADEGLLLQTAEGTVQIELGQSSYVEAQGVEFQIGDEVRVTGFYEDGDALTAGTVENLTTGETLVLRDESGRPMWAGGAGRGRRGTY